MKSLVLRSWRKISPILILANISVEYYYALCRWCNVGRVNTIMGRLKLTIFPAHEVNHLIHFNEVFLQHRTSQILQRLSVTSSGRWCNGEPFRKNVVRIVLMLQLLQPRVIGSKQNLSLTGKKISLDPVTTILVCEHKSDAHVLAIF